MQRTRRTIALVLALSCVARASHGQGGAPMPTTRADLLLDEGRWAEAEAMYYAQSERAPRDPAARAALGRFIAMKGAVKTGIVLIQEAQQFGLSPRTARELIAPLEAITEWRTSAAEFKRDSTVRARPATREGALLEIALPQLRNPREVTKDPTGPTATVWYQVVTRGIGIDSVGAQGRPLGIEVIEALVPSLNARTSTLTLHSNSRSALAASGTRYQVLRTRDEVLVLVADRRVLPLADALRELSPSWWQLDLPHGILVVR